MTANPDDVLPETPAPIPSPATAACHSSCGAEDSHAAEPATLKSEEGAGNKVWFPDFDLMMIRVPPPAAPPRIVMRPSPAANERGGGVADFTFVDLDLCAVKVPASRAGKYEWATSPPYSLGSRNLAKDDPILDHSSFAPPDLAAYEEPLPPETSSEERPALTEALFVTEIETCAYGQKETFAKQVLGELAEIKRMIPARPKSMKQTKRRSKQTVDQRLKTFHEASPDYAEEASLKVLGGILKCSPSAFNGGDYYAKTLRLKRDVARASKLMKRSGGLERFEAEDRQTIRDNKSHKESYEDIDEHIDATWDPRKGGRC